MDDYDDYARDEWINSLYSDFAKDVLAGRDDLYGEVIDQFTSERLQSYYVANPRVAAGGASTARRDRYIDFDVCDKPIVTLRSHIAEPTRIK